MMKSLVRHAASHNKKYCRGREQNNEQQCDECVLTVGFSAALFPGTSV